MALAILQFTTDGIVLLISFFGNLYILIVNGSDWIRNKTLNLTDKLICGVSAFEALFELLKACGWVFDRIRFPVDYIISLVVNLAIMSCNLWFSTCLCVNFCLTIVNCKNQFFTCLQRRSSTKIMFLLILSILASFLLILPLAYSVSEIATSNTGLITNNQTISEPLKLNGTSIRYIEAYIFVSSLGFLMSSASLLTTIMSLWRHMRRMKNNAQSFRSPKTDVHRRAISARTEDFH
ncbi:taste receptor type 2 member 104-like [Hyla sarda]|uniref:taste receptor type 2 member 104-like n=1 Tax=Hyla sarda TaxID=327740 RepID=UPI0024C2BB38|nr:taste receptor type 2 member 104-like [Hyla sarda]